MSNYTERKRILRLCRPAALILPAALLLLSLACCDRADSLQPAMPLEVSAEIAGAHTRATTTDKDETNYDKITAFENGDQINIYKGKTATGNATLYTKGTNGWAPASGASSITTTGGETFFASYPPEFTAILSNQSTHTNFWLSNRLTSTATATANRVNFQFAPAAARITIIVTYTKGTTNAAKSAKVTGTDVCTETGNTGELQLLCTSAEATRHTYTGIINPREVTGSNPYKISVTSNAGGGEATDVTQSYTEKGNSTGTPFTLQPGYEYQYNFTSTSELILSSVTVKDFTSTGETEVGPAT